MIKDSADRQTTAAQITIRTLLAALLLLVTLAVIEWQVGWQNLWLNWQTVDVRLLIWLSLLSLFSYLMRAVRIQVGFSLPFNHSPVLFHISTAHNFANILLPMRAGELAFPILMKRHLRINLFNSSTMLLLFRLLDLLALLSIGAVILLASLQQWLWLSLCIACLVLLLLAANRIKQTIVSLLTECKPTILHKLANSLSDLPTQGKPFYKVVLTTYVIWLAKIVAFLGLVLHVSDLSPLTATLSIVLADLSSVLPIHGLAGTGTYEGAFVLGSAWLEAKTSELLAAAVMLHMYLLVIAMLAAGFGWLWVKLYHYYTRCLTSPSTT
ncbi:hypothetical protein C2869_10550 [Saccharobesus litoralis]|uniref:Lysylphosphatidylglycerol synthase TM region n=1 Tax=Saccharobesus litoralis TaxID=2172099 RepID=A0A2S0VRL6_9ALTE|nr:lysylphosphatidylglycerol synthase domain-containing protein [Saccharobesus litoralis]AWB66844.1 hypothetical protein C2869_10550 [Saccharobesus litoralis]